jgi:hypothetical protein
LLLAEIYRGKIMRIDVFKESTIIYGQLEICKIDDPAASEFRIIYPNAPYGMSLDCCKSAYQARSVLAAMQCCFEAGKTARSKEISELLKK